MNTLRDRRLGPAALDAGVAAVVTGLLSWVYLPGPRAVPAALATLLAVITLHPWLRRLPVARAAGPATLVLVSLVAPGVLLVRYTQNQMRDVPPAAVAGALVFLLVLGRMARLVADQRRIAATDALTGLCTRRAFEERLHGLRRGRPVAVLLLDIDRFKRINDAFGHPAGDRVLRAVAHRLREAAGPGVTVARYGGEEFALLVPDAEAPHAARLADRLRAAIGATAVDLGGGAVRVVTISAGTAVLPTDTTSPDELIPLADRALYAAKRAGRDRVVAATPAPRPGTTRDRAAAARPAPRNRAAGAEATSRDRVTGTETTTRSRAAEAKAATRDRAADAETAVRDRAADAKAATRDRAADAETAVRDRAADAKAATRDRAAGAKGTKGTTRSRGAEAKAAMRDRAGDTETAVRGRAANATDTPPARAARDRVADAVGGPPAGAPRDWTAANAANATAPVGRRAAAADVAISPAAAPHDEPATDEWPVPLPRPRRAELEAA
ncbi:GGDEF domain-containing protein [Dactylosporangium sp. McL0621]|uniref:GGDEF domain-containing protein n=1 Tax=Dactylosporangium sp. McL0621 TaxID=3415678 RepID=UPI003CFA8A8E